MDDVEWNRWMSLTDAEQEAECDAAMEQYSAWVDDLSPEDRYAHFARQGLKSCASWRRSMKVFPFLIEYLRKSQRALLQLRRKRLPGKRLPD